MSGLDEHIKGIATQIERYRVKCESMRSDVLWWARECNLSDEDMEIVKGYLSSMIDDTVGVKISGMEREIKQCQEPCKTCCGGRVGNFEEIGHDERGKPIKVSARCTECGN